MIASVGSSLTVNAAGKETSDHTPDVSVLTLKSDKNISRFVNAEGEEVDLSGSNASTFSSRRAVLPSKYDLRDEGRITSVKNQEIDGFCWSFASNASMESNILTQKLGNATSDNLDLSESAGAWFSCNSVTDESDSTYGDHRNDPSNGAGGGNAEKAAESISSGYGVYPEELARYEDKGDGYVEALRYYSDYRLKDYSQIPEDINLIKQRIIDKGAVFYGYKSFLDNYYETEDGKWSYADNGTSIYGEETVGGHAVTIIGWDDNFSKDNFHPETGVKNDGAWLCKNSWGEEWGEDGYFYVSYDSFLYYIGQFEMQDKDSFDTIHQHQTSSDQYLHGGGDEENPQYFSSANVFTAKTTEKLEQICYSNALDSDVKVSIYELEQGYTSPEDGKLLVEFDSDVVYAGTHCLDVPANITFHEGDIFSVVIEGDTLMTNFRYEDAEHPTGDKWGKSYFSDNGTDWTDVADFSDASYAAIKAYTTKSTVDKTELANLVKRVEDYKPTNEVAQDLYEKHYYSELKPLLEEAQELLVDENATNTDIKNFCCILKAKWENIKVDTFTVNTADDFKTLYDGVRTKKFNHSYVELGADIDLSDFDCGDGEHQNSMTIDTLPKLYLNGNGHTIKNFTGENSLFGSLANSTIKNLNIENCDITGDLHVGVLAENATDSEFIDINVKNCTIHAAKSRYAAFFVGVSRSSTFTDCNIENSKIVGDKVSLFFNNTDYPSQVINCKAKDYTMIAYTFVDDNMGFNCAYQTECGIGAVEMVVTDDDCTIDNIAGEFKSVKQNGVEITPVDSKYYIDKTDGCVILDVAFFDETLEFELEVDFESRTTKISGYY